MGGSKKGSQTAVNGLREAYSCAFCKGLFWKNKKSQKFCCPEHKIAFHKLEYEKGKKVMQSGTIHLARVENSPRLQRILRVLEDGQPHSTLDIQNKAIVCAVGTSISELRNQGFNIKCRITPGKIFAYQLFGRIFKEGK